MVREHGEKTRRACVSNLVSARRGLGLRGSALLPMGAFSLDETLFLTKVGNWRPMHTVIPPQFAWLLLSSHGLRG
jgi:hypothetical protein